MDEFEKHKNNLITEINALKKTLQELNLTIQSLRKDKDHLQTERA